MKRFLVVVLEIIILLLLQTTVFQWFSLAGITPNLLLILAVSTGFMRGRSAGLLVGFFSGLLIDCLYGNIIGLCALIYMLIGYLNGYANKIFVKDDFTIPLILVGVSELIYFFLYYIFTFLLEGKLNIAYYFFHIGVPRIVYTVLAAIIVYRLLNIINFLLFEKKDEEASNV